MSLQAWKEQSRSFLGPITGVLVTLGVPPTAITLFGLLLHVWSAVEIGRGRAPLGGLILILASVCDALDGEVARKTGKSSRFGAFLDSTVDRIEETLILAGITAYFISSGDISSGDNGWGKFWPTLTVMVLGGSVITSYARARAEGLGLECKVGVLERPERIVITILGLLLQWWFLKLAMLFLFAMTWVTVYQRIMHVYGLLRDPAAPDEPQAEASSARPQSTGSTQSGSEPTPNPLPEKDLPKDGTEPPGDVVN